MNYKLIFASAFAGACLAVAAAELLSGRPAGVAPAAWVFGTGILASLYGAVAAGVAVSGIILVEINSRLTPNG